MLYPLYHFNIDIQTIKNKNIKYINKPMQLRLCADFIAVDKFDNLVFKYYYPDPQNSKSRLNSAVASAVKSVVGSLSASLPTSAIASASSSPPKKQLHLPNNSNGFKIKRGDIPISTTQLHIGKPVIVDVKLVYYKFTPTNTADAEPIAGYKLVGVGMSPAHDNAVL
jgi:hypothetical protein